MPRTERLSSEEAKMVGSLLRELRSLNELNQSDLGTMASISRIEAGKQPISAKKAYELLTSVVATEADHLRLEALVSQIPSLAKESNLDRTFTELGNDVHKFGAQKKIAGAVGLSLGRVRRKLGL